MNEGNWSAFRTVLLALAAGYAGDNASLHSNLTDAITDIYVAGPALVSLVTMAIGIWKNHNTKKVPQDSVAISKVNVVTTGEKGSTAVIKDAGSSAQVLAKVVGCLALFAFLVFGAVQNAGAADFTTVKALPAVPNCASAQACSGWYAAFGFVNSADLASKLTGSDATATNGDGLMVAGGYQLWRGQILAGAEIGAGYEFGTAGNTGGFIGTEFVKLGYNFFPSTETAVTTPGQSPVTSIVPANLLATSTPYAMIGGVQRHGISAAAVGVGVETFVAAGWSAAFEYYNAPSTRGLPDENVFRIMAQKHF